MSLVLLIKRIRDIIDSEKLTISEVIDKEGSPSISAKAPNEGERTVRV